MSDERLLSILCHWLRELRHKITIRLASSKEELALNPNSLNLIHQIAEKERELALMSPHARRPCPLCFIHGKTSHLYPLPKEHKEDSVKCDVCKERFFFPAGRA